MKIKFVRFVFLATLFAFAFFMAGCDNAAVGSGSGSSSNGNGQDGGRPGGNYINADDVPGTYADANYSITFDKAATGSIAGLDGSSPNIRAAGGGLPTGEFNWRISSDTLAITMSSGSQNGQTVPVGFNTGAITIYGKTYPKKNESPKPQVDNNPLLCAVHEWAFDHIGEKINPADNTMWHYHRAFCKVCGYEYPQTDWCTSTHGCSQCEWKSVAENGSYDMDDAQAQFIPITETFDKIVIVANNGFKDSAPLKKYIDHKKKNFTIVEKYYPTGKSAEEIRSELKTEYEATKTAGQTMCVLIVGRGGNYHNYSIPEFVSKNKPVLEGRQRVGATDFYYGYYENGTTHLFPQVVVGRLSARNISELQAQVDKIVKMETEPRTANKNIVLVQQKRNDGTTPFADESREISEYVGSKLPGYTVATKYTNEPDSINSAINSGAMLVSYSGHGGFDFWGDSRYNVNNIRGLRNSFYPIVLGVTCNSGDFTYGDECVAEAFMRNANGGAVGYIGASTVMIAYYSKAATMGNDKIPGMVSSLLYSTPNNYGNNYKVETLGGMFLAALRRIKMSKTYSNNQTYKDYSIEILNLFGDPTYKPYMGN